MKNYVPVPGGAIITANTVMLEFRDRVEFRVRVGVYLNKTKVRRSVCTMLVL